MRTNRGRLNLYNAGDGAATASHRPPLSPTEKLAPVGGNAVTEWGRRQFAVLDEEDTAGPHVLAMFWLLKRGGLGSVGDLLRVRGVDDVAISGWAPGDLAGGNRTALIGLPESGVPWV